MSRNVNRRHFLRTAAMGSAAMAMPRRMFAAESPAKRPNILWILSEDICPDLRCYGTPVVQTPNLDTLASQGVRYVNAFTTSPVCSASRSAMITGMYQTSIGAHHHRSHRGDGYRLPEPVRLITDYLREAGYFTANVTTAAPGVSGSGKTDFNFHLDHEPFDGTDWNQRKPGQPFFAQLSIKETHRGGHWKNLAGKMENPVDPDKVALPPYFPDHPIARQDWATYLDSIQLMDQYVGKILERLDDEGLTESTVVIFIGDHGRCHVRGKQWVYDAGIRIPLLVRWPGKLEAGTVCDDLVSAIDISATVLKIAGITPPAHMHGRVFLGPDARKREYIFAARDRCDETVECIRCVHTKRYSYIRNYMPYRPYMQSNRYKDTSYPMRNLLRQLHGEGKLTPAQEQFMAPRKPVEELYELQNDPHEIYNLADSPEHQQVLKQLRAAHIEWMRETKDLGLIPEPELEDLYETYGSQYNILEQKGNENLIDRIRAVIELGEKGKAGLRGLIEAMEDKQPSVRYWAAIGLGNLDRDARPAERVLTEAMEDTSGSVRVAAARALCRMNMEDIALPVLLREMQGDNKIVRHYAALELEDIGEKARPALDALKAARNDSYDGVRRVATRVVNTLEDTADLRR